MADLKAFIDGMVWWCESGNLGYDQANRWDLRVGGETDCSALTIGVLKKAGFDTGSATYTGNMRSNLTARGWKVVATNVRSTAVLQAGDILLNDTHHVAVYVGGGRVAQASIDERGKIAGGQSGDQTNRETNVTPFYVYWAGWSCALRYTGAKTVSENPLPKSTSATNPNDYDQSYVATVQTLLFQAGYSVGAAGATVFSAPTR